MLLQTYLTKESLDDLVTTLTKGRVAHRLLDLMPPSKRTLEDFSTHFRSGNRTEVCLGAALAPHCD